MKLHQYQIGASIWGIMIVVLLAILAGHTAFKLLPVYMEDMAVKSVVNGLESDPDTQYSRPGDVHGAVFRRFGVNNISRVSRDDVIVLRDGDRFLVDVIYEVRVPYLANISLVMVFEHRAEVRAR